VLDYLVVITLKLQVAQRKREDFSIRRSATVGPPVQFEVEHVDGLRKKFVW